MPHFLDWCDEASVVHWVEPDEALPSWTEADKRMRESGRPFRVRNPSSEHTTLSYKTPTHSWGAANPTRKTKLRSWARFQTDLLPIRLGRDALR